MRISDWSSYVCSSDLAGRKTQRRAAVRSGAVRRTTDRRRTSRRPESGSPAVSMTKRILAWVEPPIFHYRQYTLLALLLITVLLGWQAAQLKPDAGWLKMVPKQHTYMQTFQIGRASYRERVCQ